MRSAVPAISAGDISWVVASIAAIALGWFSMGGAIVIGVVGLMVAAFGAAQLVMVKHLEDAANRGVEQRI